jgi:hypothetical protein
MNEVFEIDGRKYALKGVFPACVFVSEKRREALLLELSSDRGDFSQFVYKSTGHNSRLPNAWLPFCGVHWMHIQKIYVDPDTLLNVRASSNDAYGRYGHPLYVALSEYLSRIPLDPSDFPEIEVRATTPMSHLVAAETYDSILDIQCRNSHRMVSFINERCPPCV